MTRKTIRIQATIPINIKEWLEVYQKENGLPSFGASLVELLNLAIRIKENSKEDDSISNRKLLEEILKHTVISEKIIRSTYGHSYIKGKLSDPDFKNEVKGSISSIVENALLENESILKK